MRKTIQGSWHWLSALPLLGIILAMSVLAITALAGAQAPNATLRNQIFDFYQRMVPASAGATTPYHVISIDRQSLEAIGPWPWPRSVLAELVTQSSRAGARAVIVAEPIDSPDPLSPEVIGGYWLRNLSDETLADQLIALPSTDETLAASLARLDSALAISADPMAIAHARTSMANADTRNITWLKKSETTDFVTAPIATPKFSVNRILGKSAPLTVASLPYDEDGIVRHLPLFWSVDQEVAPALALEAARLAQGVSAVRIDIETNAIGNTGREVNKVTIGNKTLPLSNGVLRFYSPKKLGIEQTSAVHILQGERSRAQLKDKVVLIGLDAENGKSVNFAKGKLSQVQAHAQFAKQLIEGISLKRPSWIGYIEALSVMVLGAIAIITAQKCNFWQALGLALAVMVLLFGASFGAFISSQTLLDPVPGALALLLGAFTVAGGRTLGVALRDDAVRGVFHDTLPEDAMRLIREKGGENLLHGVRRPVTVLSCELRILDTDLEKLADTPHEITTMLASATNALRATILKTGGAADQADGGKLYAYYNAPLQNADHVDAACSAALRLVESMDAINSELEASKALRGLQIHLAIGISTGECTAGPMGRGRNNRYSAIGPAITMASFLRRQAEFYGPAIICDEAVYRQSHHRFAYLELDRLRTNQKDQPVSIFALVGNPFIKSSKNYRTLDETHRDLLAAYRAGDFKTAKKHLETIREQPGASVALFDIYENRIKKMADQEELPADWDGVISVTL